jgi:hypothetical protein
MNEENATDIFLWADELNMAILKKAWIDYLGVKKTFKRMEKNGTLKGLSTSSLKEIKSRRKELKKEKSVEEKEKKNGKKNAQLAQVPDFESFFALRKEMTPESDFTAVLTPALRLSQQADRRRRNSVSW